MVLDGLGFVQNAGIERLFRIPLFVPAQQVVAGHHKVGVLPLLCQLCTVGGVAVHRHTDELRRELFAFLLPVEHQRCRADDETGQGLPAFLHGQQVAEHLHRLAQAHIVRQNAAHAVAIQSAEPAVTVPLVLAQHLLQRGRRGILTVLHRVEAAADAPERIVPVEADPVLTRKGAVQTGRAVQRQLNVLFAQLRARKLQRFVQLVQRLQGVIQPQQPTVPQAVVALFLVQGPQQLPQLSHRELSGIHLQVQHAAVYRHPHRNFRRRGL